MDRLTAMDEADLSSLGEAEDTERSLLLSRCPFLSSGKKAILPPHTLEGLMWMKPTGVSRQP